VARIRALVRRSAPTRAKLDLNEIIQEVLAIINAEARQEGILMRTELAAGARRPRAVAQVILTLVMNGIEAMKEVADRPR
jgi:signal transduction histidine kinase